jgi:uncharacterized protein (DUF2235 family)
MEFKSMKRIVICCDGTWNTPDKKDKNTYCDTNVVKIAEAVKETAADSIRQFMYYHPGVGTSGSFLQRVFDGATGTGISRNILDAYRYLILNYEIGDELYFIGFSRGAFTVRSLVGLIRNSGILQPKMVDLIGRAYKLYKSRRPSSHPNQKEAVLFRKTYAVANITPIKFVGVWDTVGALGNPLLINTALSNFSFSILGNQFHDTDLSSHVANAYQALAIDEKRLTFQPTLWKKQAGSKNQILEQVWFAGVHSNVGGGYPSTDLSDIALRWMEKKLRECSLDLNDIPDRSQLDGRLMESWKFPYTLIQWFPSYRTIGKFSNSEESLSDSALTRYNNIDLKYHPKNLVEYLRKTS